MQSTVVEQAAFFFSCIEHDQMHKKMHMSSLDFKEKLSGTQTVHAEIHPEHKFHTATGATLVKNGVLQRYGSTVAAEARRF